MKVDPKNYDYIMYVDASGDDGFNFETATTTCYAAAALTVKHEDIPANQEILSQIKKIVGCKETDEVKYSTLRRHRRSAEALSLLERIQGSLSCYVVFKKEIDKHKYIGNKNMSIICHYMALRAVNSLTLPSDKVLIAIDRMKQTEEKPLKFVVDDHIKAGKLTHPAEVIFRDSKDANFLLIQIADLLCGIIREHFEQYEINSNMTYFMSVCPRCQKLFEIKKKYIRIQCKNGSSRSQAIINSKNLKYIWHLFPQRGSPRFLDYFFTEPTKAMYHHFYMACNRKK